MPKAENTGQELLQQVAEVAGDKMKKKCTIELKSAENVAVSWLSTAVHPFQPLQTIHQRLANEAAGKIKVEGNRNAMDEQQEAKEETLRQYFLSMPSEPQLLMDNGTQPEDESPIEILNRAQKVLRAIGESFEVQSEGKGRKGLITIRISPGTLMADGKSEANITIKVLDTKTGKPVNKDVDVELKLEEIYKGKSPDPYIQDAGPKASSPPAKDNKQLKVKAVKGVAEVTFFAGGEPEKGKTGKVAITAESPGTGTASAIVSLILKKVRDEFIEDTRVRLDGILESCQKIYNSFENCGIGGEDPKPYTPILKNIYELLETCRDEFDDGFTRIGPNILGEIKSLCDDHFESLVEELSRAVEGLAQIQMIFGIDAFYLFRLLVPFNIVAGKRLDKGIKRDASSELTDFINNNLDKRTDMLWVTNWLKQKMIDLDKAIAKIPDYREKVFFHLKGGRALQYILETPEKGENDWDTAIVINPHLTPEDWYSTLNKVHNIVLQELRQAKQEFFILLHKYKPDVMAKLNEVRKAIEEKKKEKAKDKDDLNEDDLFDYVEKEGNACKAELIDIGTPRIDTIEAIEQWKHTGPKKEDGGNLKLRIITEKWTDNVPVPPHYYFVDEYIVMVREALANVSPAPHKACKRIRRLFAVMNLDEGKNSGKILKKEIEDVQKEIDGDLFKKSLKVIGDLKDVYVKRTAPVLLNQFMHSYDLKLEGGLAQIFDTEFEKLAKNADDIDLGDYPEVKDGVDKEKKGKKFDEKTHEKVLKWIMLADKISKKFEDHFQERAKYFGFGAEEEDKKSAAAAERSQPRSGKAAADKCDACNRPIPPEPDKRPKVPDKEAERRRLLGSFIKAIYTYGAFKQSEELEVQMALGGSFAAHLHGDYSQFKEILRKKLDPVRTIDLKLYCYQPSVLPGLACRVMLLPAIYAYLENTLNPAFHIDAPAPDDFKKYIKTPGNMMNYLKAVDALLDKDAKAWDGSINIWWPEEVDIAGFKYQPLAVRVTVETPGVWPQIAFAWGYPVLSLRDLIREYDRKAALTEEWGRKRKLKGTSDILKGLLTRFDFKRVGVDMKFEKK